MSWYYFCRFKQWLVVKDFGECTLVKQCNVSYRAGKNKSTQKLYDWVFDSRQNVVIFCHFFVVVSSANSIAFIQLFYYAKAAKKLSCYCPSGYRYSCVFHTFLSSALSTINPQWLTQQTQKAKDALLTPYPVSQLCLSYSILENFSFSSHNIHEKTWKSDTEM